MAAVMGYGHGIPHFGMQASNRAALAAAAHSVQAHRVYVGNLPYAVGWRELKDFMREAGEVSFAEVLMGPDGRSKVSTIYRLFDSMITCLLYSVSDQDLCLPRAAAWLNFLQLMEHKKPSRT